MVIAGQAAVVAIGEGGGVDRHQIGFIHIFAVETGRATGGDGFTRHKSSWRDAQCRRGGGGAVIGFAGRCHRGRQGLGRDAGRHRFAGGINRIVAHDTAVVAGHIAEHQAVHRDLVGGAHILAVVSRARVAEGGRGVATDQARPGVGRCKAGGRSGAAVIHLGHTAVADGGRQGFGRDGGRHGFAVGVHRIVADQTAGGGTAGDAAGQGQTIHCDLVGTVDPGTVVVGRGVAGAGGGVAGDETQPSEAGHKAGGCCGGAVIHLGDPGVVHAGGQCFRRDAGGHALAGRVQHIVAGQAARAAGDTGDGQAIHREPIGGADIAAVVTRGGVAQGGRVVAGDQARPGVGGRKTAGCRCAAVIHLGHIGVADGRRDGFARDAGGCSLARCQAVVGGQAAIVAIGQTGGVDGHQVGGADVLAVVTGCPCGGHGFGAHQAAGDAQHGGGRVGAVIGFARSGCCGREGFRRDGGCHGFGRGVQRIVGQGAAVAAGDAACQGQAIDGHRRGRDHVFAVVARARVGQRSGGVTADEA